MNMQHSRPVALYYVVSGCMLLLSHDVNKTNVLHNDSVMYMLYSKGSSAVQIWALCYLIQFDIVIFMVMDAGAVCLFGWNEQSVSFRLVSLSPFSLCVSLSPLSVFSGLQFNLCVFCLREGNRPALQRSVIYIDLPFGWRDGWGKRERWEEERDEGW